MDINLLYLIIWSLLRQLHFITYIVININTLGFSTPRALALGTVAATLGLSMISGVFSEFSPTILPGNTCSPGYGYDGYTYGYGYGDASGYDCVPDPVVIIPETPIVGPGGGGGGGGGGPYVPPPSTVPPSSGSVVILESEDTVLFPDFAKSCSDEVTSLNDSRIMKYYDTLQILDRVNTNARYITRSEFLKLTLNAAAADVSMSGSVPYTDVAQNHSLINYIAYATRMGIVSGQDNMFRPDEMISRGEAVKILLKATRLNLATSSSSFSDAPASYSLAMFVQTAKDNCIAHGVTATTFEPLRGISIAETVKILYNMTRAR